MYASWVACRGYIHRRLNEAGHRLITYDAPPWGKTGSSDYQIYLRPGGRHLVDKSGKMSFEITLDDPAEEACIKRAEQVREAVLKLADPTDSLLKRGSISCDIGLPMEQVERSLTKASERRFYRIRLTMGATPA